MKRLARLIMFSSALIGAQVMATPAFAQKTAPDGTYRGLVDVNKGIPLTCTIELELSGGVATVTYFGPPVATACSSVSFVNQPYSYTFDPLTGDVVLSGVKVNTITIGDCAGSITANWVNDEITVDSYLPADTAGPDCTIAGVLDFVPDP